ncbi:MAG TPA: AtpZ/AtpI family protein [Roseiarcus sp.]|nr:AtpZ/AtpI family protein [Roseiarcus sp.]
MAEDDDERLRASLDRLKSSLSQARGEPRVTGGRPAENSEPQRGDSGMSLAMRAGSEFITAVVLGAAIGWGLDRLLKTNPAFLIVFFFLGVASGVWNVIRLTSPKGGGGPQDSRLSRPNAADKGGRHAAPASEREPARGREASRGASEPSGWADDDED